MRRSGGAAVEPAEPSSHHRMVGTGLHLAHDRSWWWSATSARQVRSEIMSSAGAGQSAPVGGRRFGPEVVVRIASTERPGYVWTFAQRSHLMRTSLPIDDALMEEAMRASGVKTQREAVELGLETLVRLGRQAEARLSRGKLHWIGDLEDDENRQVIVVDQASASATRGRRHLQVRHWTFCRRYAAGTSPGRGNCACRAGSTEFPHEIFGLADTLEVLGPRRRPV